LALHNSLKRQVKTQQLSERKLTIGKDSHCSTINIKANEMQVMVLSYDDQLLLNEGATVLQFEILGFFRPGKAIKEEVEEVAKFFFSLTPARIHGTLDLLFEQRRNARV
jgi:hypothetical protein